MCVVVCFRSQCVLLYVYVAMCVIGSFRWQSELLGLLCGNVYFGVF